MNGGSIADKVDFARNHFEKEIPVNAVFAKDEMIDVIGVTRATGSRASPPDGTLRSCPGRLTRV